MYVYLVTGRNEVLAKVIFSQACVILFTGRQGGSGSRGSSKFLGVSIFSGGSPPEYGQRSAGTHPTGMHSCDPNAYPSVLNPQVLIE